MPFIECLGIDFAFQQSILAFIARVHFHGGADVLAPDNSVDLHGGGFLTKHWNDKGET
jgi:hypothetical protein